MLGGRGWKKRESCTPNSIPHKEEKCRVRKSSFLQLNSLLSPPEALHVRAFDRTEGKRQRSISGLSAVPLGPRFLNL